MMDELTEKIQEETVNNAAKEIVKLFALDSFGKDNAYPFANLHDKINGTPNKNI